MSQYPFSKYKLEVISDLYRHGGQRGWRALLKQVLFGEGASYSFWMRTCAFLRADRLTKYTLFPFAKLLYRRSCIKFGVWIPYSTAIEYGLHLAHASNIYINGGAKIGRNLTISQGVTIGSKPGPNGGVPRIGNNVYIGPGAKIIGPIKVGDDVVIGANAVVVQDVPAGVAVGGVPAKILGPAPCGYCTNRIL